MGVAEDRFRLEEAQFAVSRLLKDMRTEYAAFALEDGDSTGERMRTSILNRRQDSLRSLLERSLDVIRSVNADLLAARSNARRIDTGTRRTLEAISKLLQNDTHRSVIGAQRGLDQKNHGATQRDLTRIVDRLEIAAEQFPALVKSADRSFYNSLSDTQRAEIEKAVRLPRREVARQALLSKTEDGKTVIEKLQENFEVRFVRFGSKAAVFDGEQWLESGKWSSGQKDSFRSLTDLSKGFDLALKEVPAESLAGALVLTDGRHNAEARIEDVARRYGIQRSPICSVLVGSSVGPRDAGFIDVRAPQSIYLGDKIRVAADLRIDGLRGERVNVRLFQDDRELKMEEILVSEDASRPTIYFRDIPDEKGTFTYRVKIDPIDGEKYPDDNEWEFETAVSDDRMNVLLLDDRPRWEFRYLRNLFYGRDKSIHLQFVLLQPDRIAGQPSDAPIVASAAREFGDSRATSLPETLEEWMQFDAIIFGDIPPDAVDDKTWDFIETCVSERAAMLVCIAGPASMPHAISNERFRAMCPVVYDTEQSEYFASPETEYRIALTAEGRKSTIMQQSSSDLINEQIWAEMPNFYWRHPVVGVKEGAEVLAYATLPGSRETLNTFDSVEEALALQEGQKKFEKEHALVTVQGHGIGKVAMLNFDRTWRFRYGVGDVYHHRFWGQLMRWGVGESLRSGTRNVRLGTDLLSYTPGSPIRILAKLIDESHRPVASEKPIALVYNKGDELVSRIALSYRKNSYGMYEAELSPMTKPGRYRIRLEGDRISELLKEDGAENVSTYFNILANRNPIELAELTVDRSYLATAATLSGGTIVEPDAAASLIDFFNAENAVIVEPKKTTLWDSLPLLLLLVALVGAEWIIRRRGGLA